MVVKAKLLHADAKLPTRATPGSVGMDLYSCEHMLISPGACVYVPTGVALELPRGSWAQVLPRSGLFMRGINVHVGTIDTDYRGEIKVGLHNTADRGLFVVRVGDRIGQIVLHQFYSAEFELVDELSETKRGTGGFGSTGR